jgi:GMP synthase (glutamine-hydrolysing)
VNGYPEPENHANMSPTVLILRHMPHEPGGTLELALIGAGLDFRYVDLYEETPARLPLDRAAGLVVLGGPMNVDQVDRYPFLARDVEWIGQSLDLDLPLLGICLGSQLLAKTLGARVYPSRVKEIGWCPIELTAAAAADSLLAQSAVQTVFQWHGDTFDLPSGAIHLARSPQCENQAFRFGRSAYGLQFHIEMTAAMIDDWLSEPGNCRELAALDYIDPQAIRDQTPRELPRLQSLAAEVLGRFAQMCRS